MHNHHGFTLVEVLVAVALTGVILLTGYSAFQRIMQAQSRLGATIDVQKNLFYTNEKMAALIREGGTIDYEEYFNRRMLGYARSMVDTPIDAETSLSDTYTFTNVSRFGNGINSAGKQTLYYCGVFGGIDGEGCMDNTTDVLFNSSFYPPTPPATTVPLTYHFSLTPPEHQPYGQYSALSLNYNDPVGFPMPIKLPPIFITNPSNDQKIQITSREANGALTLEKQDASHVGLPELYLIKKNLDSTYTRTYFRHVYVQDSFPGAPTCSNPTSSLDGCLGKIQMTKLESCDIDTDGTIDAWIPAQEFWIGTVAWGDCAGIIPDAASIYKAAHEDKITSPADDDPNLTWIDVTDPDMNVVRATFLPNPLKVPSLMSGSGEPAQSPTVSVYLEVQLSTRLRNKSFVASDMNYPRTLITTYDLSE